MNWNRANILKRLRAKLRVDAPLSVAAGTGISAKMRRGRRHRSDHHLQLGRFRMAGHGSLAGLMPFGNANQIVKEMAYEVLPTFKYTPVLAGVAVPIRS